MCLCTHVWGGGAGEERETGSEREGGFVRCPNLVSLAVINTVTERNFEKRGFIFSSYW